MHKGIDWDDLLLVLAIARGEGLSGAARLLGLNHATVFRRLNQLEQRVGVRLFDGDRRHLVRLDRSHRSRIRDMAPARRC